MTNSETTSVLAPATTSLFPQADMQHLRALRRAALKESEAGKPPRSYRAIFQALKELDALTESDQQ